MNREPVFSIIIPVYNTDLMLLNKCLLSIFSQSFLDFEVLIIDGGSNKEVLDCLEKFASDYKNIKMFNSNKGVSKQRNLGLKNARGKYIAFIDSDDYVNKDYLSELYNICLASNADIIAPDIKCTKYINNAFEIVYSYDQYVDLNYKVSDGNFFRDISKNGLAFVFKAYKKEVLENLRFDENLSFGEDMYFNYCLSEKRELIVKKCNKAIYFYNRPNQGSLLSNRVNLNTIKFLDKLLELKKKHKDNKQNVEGIVYQYNYVFKSFYYECLRQRNYKIIRKIFSKRLIYLRSNFSIKTIVYILFPRLYCLIKKINHK